VNGYGYLHICIFDISGDRMDIKLLQELKIPTDYAGYVSPIKDLSPQKSQNRFLSFTHFYYPIVTENCRSGPNGMPYCSGEVTRLVDMKTGRDVYFIGKALSVSYGKNIATYRVLDFPTGQIKTVQVNLKRMKVITSRGSKTLSDSRRLGAWEWGGGFAHQGIQLSTGGGSGGFSPVFKKKQKSKKSPSISRYSSGGVR
jgi:hypothetical protein